jgi:phage FluMu protein Com
MKIQKIVYLDTHVIFCNMVEIEDLRVCMECGTVFAKKPSSSKLIFNCPTCNSIRRTTIALHEKLEN